jgi:predicted  nucleic acid-binding Zn-ribbon protein
MPHKCVSCFKVYPNSSPELLKGCCCGSRIFLYLRGEDVAMSDAMGSGLGRAMESGKIQALSRTQPVSVEMVDPGEAEAGRMSDYLGAGQQQAGTREQPAENITVINRGEYELDIDSIMRGEPLVVRSQNGIYYLKIPSTRRWKQ